MNRTRSPGDSSASRSSRVRSWQPPATGATTAALTASRTAPTAHAPMGTRRLKHITSGGPSHLRASRSSAQDASGGPVVEPRYHGRCVAVLGSGTRRAEEVALAQLTTRVAERRELPERLDALRHGAQAQHACALDHTGARRANVRGRRRRQASDPASTAWICRRSRSATDDASVKSSRATCAPAARATSSATRSSGPLPITSRVVSSHNDPGARSAAVIALARARRSRVRRARRPTRSRPA